MIVRSLNLTYKLPIKRLEIQGRTALLHLKTIGVIMA